MKKRDHHPTRRRFLQIVGVSAGSLAAGVPLSLWLLRDQRKLETLDLPCWTWQGVALGANTSIQIHGVSEKRGLELTSACFERMRELEMVFSLYEKDSAVSQLNRNGRLDHPPQELVELLLKAKSMHGSTNGAFDVTVQPIWECYASHYGSNPLAESPPSPSDVRDALAKVGSRYLEVSRDAIAFSRPGMSLTVNGIAQGFITDVITDFLKSEDVDNTLVNLGEYRAIGQHPQGRSWEIGVRSPQAGSDTVSTDLLDSLPLDGEQALAVSSGSGTTFDIKNQHHHLWHPGHTRQQATNRTIAIRCGSATEADALSTACSVVDDSTARALARRLGAAIEIYPA